MAQRAVVINVVSRYSLGYRSGVRKLREHTNNQFVKLHVAFGSDYHLDYSGKADLYSIHSSKYIH